MADIDRHKLYHEFQEAFPLEKLSELTLERYTNLNRSDSFCYWLESKTEYLGSIWGGSAYKFGIFYRNSEPGDNSKFLHDENYSWYASLASDRDTAFERIKVAIIKIATAARNGEYEQIDEVSEFGDVCKWKIAFLYSDEKLIPIYKRDFLLTIAKAMGHEFKKNVPLSAIQRFLISQQGDKNIFDYYAELLQIHAKANTLVQKTLTDITKYPDFVKQLNKLAMGQASTEEPQYWWLTASPAIWSLTNMKVNEEQDYTLYNDNGNQRRIFQNFLDARLGDKVIGYEANPRKQIVALAEISREQDGETILFRKTESLIHPIDLATFKTDPELAEMQFIKNPNGSFFRLTKDEYDYLMELIRQTNPTQQLNKRAHHIQKMISSPTYLCRCQTLHILKGYSAARKTLSCKERPVSVRPTPPSGLLMP